MAKGGTFRRGWRHEFLAVPVPYPRSLSSAFIGFRFPAEIIVLALRRYLRYGLSYRDVEELVAERGIDVDHVTVYRWVPRFTPVLADTARVRWYLGFGTEPPERVSGTHTMRGLPHWAICPASRLSEDKVVAELLNACLFVSPAHA